ncbi:sugar phosphate nucleotidyltransferase, partial [Acidobacteriia bacterium AH_259_A11_L15]|nr:sugar phosphate nucleotidyltransferase [Acidobacteriia bacterium AH_259_A11_L15]
MEIDLGVLEVDDAGSLIAYHEKPVREFQVSMGIYVFEPRVLELLPPDQPCDLPDLVRRILASDEKLYVYPFDGYWLDIGRPDDYAR